MNCHMFSEYFNVYTVRSHAYSRWMPTTAGIGHVPMLQWVVVPTMIIQLARSGIVGASFRAGIPFTRGLPPASRSIGFPWLRKRWPSSPRGNR